MFGFGRAARGDAPAPGSSEAPPAPAASPEHTLYAARQPILGRRSELIGYELLFRAGPENRFDSTDADHATLATIEGSAAVFGLDTMVGNHRAYVNLTRRALLGGYHRMLPPHRTVIELLETIEPDAEVIAACRAIRREGYTLALDDYVFTPHSEPLLDVVSLVKVDVRQTERAFDADALAPLRARGLTLLAEKVETHEEHTAAMAAGYAQFQGYFFCKPQMVQTPDLPPAKHSVVRFMAEMLRQEEFAVDRLEEVFRHDPALTVRLLRYLNSAAFGWRYEFGSLRQALTVIGLRPLKQWSMMIGLLALGEGHPHELSRTALARARFAERLAAAAGLHGHEGELFLAGLLSLVDTMLGRPREEVLSALTVPARVHAALAEGTGPLAPALRLVRAYERADWEALEAARAACPVDDRALTEAYADAIAWAETVTAA